MPKADVLARLLKDEPEWQLMVFSMPGPDRCDFTMGSHLKALPLEIREEFDSLLNDRNLLISIACLKFDDGTPGLTGTIMIVPEGAVPTGASE